MRKSSADRYVIPSWLKSSELMWYVCPFGNVRLRLALATFCTGRSVGSRNWSRNGMCPYPTDMPWPPEGVCIDHWAGRECTRPGCTYKHSGPVWKRSKEHSHLRPPAEARSLAQANRGGKMLSFEDIAPQFKRELSRASKKIQRAYQSSNEGPTVAVTRKWSPRVQSPQAL